jgi:chaperonin GroES
MQVRPLHDRSKGGIIIPDTAKEKPSQGEVIAVGQGRIGDDGKVRPLDVKKGDRILFGKYSGTEIKIEGDEYLMMREEDILGVVASN